MYRCLVCGEILTDSRRDALIEHLRIRHPFINVGGTLPSSRRLAQPCGQTCIPELFPTMGTPAPCGPVPYCAATGPRRTTKASPFDPRRPQSPCDPCRSTCAPCPAQVGPCGPPNLAHCPPCPPPCAPPCGGPTEAEYCKALAKQQRKEYRTKYKCTMESYKLGCSTVVCPSCGCENQPHIRNQRSEIADSTLGACLLMGCWPFTFLPFVLCESTLVNLYCATCNTFLGAYNRKLGCVVDVQGSLCAEGPIPNFPAMP